MQKFSVIAYTLLGILLCLGIGFFSFIALDISDGNYADRLAQIIASLDPATQASELWKLKVCRYTFILSAQLPYAEFAAAGMGAVALLLALLGKARAASRVYWAAFALPLVVVAPLMVTAPLSSSLTRREGVADLALTGAYLLVVWVLLSGLGFLSASAAAKALRA